MLKKQGGTRVHLTVRTPSNINGQTYHDFTTRNSRNTLQLKILPEKITKETVMGKHVKGIMYFSFIFLEKSIAKPSNDKMLGYLNYKLKDCIFSEVRRKNYTGLCAI